MFDRIIRWSQGPSGLPFLRGDWSYCAYDRTTRCVPPLSGLPCYAQTGSSGGPPDHPVCAVLLERRYLNFSSLSLPPSFTRSGVSFSLSLHSFDAPVCILPISSEGLRIVDRRAGNSSSRPSPPTRANLLRFFGRNTVSSRFAPFFLTSSCS